MGIKELPIVRWNAGKLYQIGQTTIAKDCEGRQATRHGYEEVVQLLLNQKGKPNMPDNDGQTLGG